MASSSYDYKPDGSMSYTEKPGFTTSSSSSEPAEYGQVSQAKQRRGFSLAVNQEPSSFAATPSASNADFDPTPPSRRTWSWLAYVSYWMADAWAVSNWGKFCLHWMSEDLADQYSRGCIFHDCCWAELERGHWCMCPRKHDHGNCNHGQRQDWCYSEYF
jgi:hypothetical protein